MPRRAIIAAVALLAGAGGVVAVSPDASAVVAAGSCQSTSSAALSPGLTGTAQIITTTISAGKATACTGPIAPTATATFSGRLTSVAPGQDCLNGTAKGTLTVKWANGQVTKIAVTQKPNPATSTPFDAILTGRATSGPGAAQGATIRSVQTLTPTAGNCLVTPLTAATLAGKLSIRTP